MPGGSEDTRAHLGSDPANYPSRPWAQGHARRGPGGTLRSADQSFSSGRQANARRFPADFMFHLTSAEHENLRSRSVTSSLNRGWGGRRSLPYAFTEQGVGMLSSVL